MPTRTSLEEAARKGSVAARGCGTVVAMATINPTLEQIEAFERATPDAAPIVMLNLLKFRERADCAEGGTGREAYERYSKAVLPLLWEAGGQPLWMGRARAGVIVPEGEGWDEAFLVHYPSRAAFLGMVKSPAYQKIMHHRTAALSDSRLIETTAVPLPQWVLGAGRAFWSSSRAGDGSERSQDVAGAAFARTVFG